jgi:hypothetical protein
MYVSTYTDTCTHTHTHTHIYIPPLWRLVAIEHSSEKLKPQVWVDTQAKNGPGQLQVTYTCNLSYSRSRDQEDLVKASPGK